jgi:hypothetical protein
MLNIYKYNNLINIKKVKFDKVIVYKTNNNYNGINLIGTVVKINENVLNLNYNFRYFNELSFERLLIDTILKKSQHISISSFNKDVELLKFTDFLLLNCYQKHKYSSRILLNYKVFYKLLKFNHIYQKTNSSYYLKNVELIINNYISEYNCIIINDGSLIDLYMNNNNFTIDIDNNNFTVIHFDINSLKERRINKLKNILY